MSRIHWSLMLCLSLFVAMVSGCGSDSGSNVSPLSLNTQASRTRTYYIAAEDVVWDFAPTGVDQITGVPFANLSTPSPFRSSTEFVMTRRIAFDPVSSAANPASFTAEADRVQIGTRYKKTLFFEYTDATFTEKKPVPPEWRHLGALGPVIRAQVGDTIQVVFKNKTDLSRSFTMHPHGVFYTKANEGAPYVSGAPDAFSAGNNVPPGSSYTYTWPVPDRAGPGPGDGVSVLWMYHSHFDETRDENTGLIGPMIIYAKGSLRPDGTVVGVDREFVTLFKIYDENTSFHFQQNLQTAKLTSEMIDEVIQDDGFDPEPNLKHTINGYLFGNMPLEDMTMRQGERVRWYLMSMGTEIDLHTPHWHGNTVLEESMRTDVIDLLPAQMVTAEMVPDNVGTWLFHCHVNDHLLAGMVTRYRVIP